MNRRLTRSVWRIGLAITAAVLALPAPVPAATVHASSTDLGALMARALDNVHSFKLVNDSTTMHASASPGDVMKMHIEEVFVRRGTGFAMSMQTTVDGKYSAEVYTGTHVCLKQTAGATWNCSVPPSYAKALLANIDPVKGFKASGVVMTSVVSAGTKSVQGQLCTGYRFAMSVAAIHLTGHGTIWFSSANGRVVQITEISTAALLAGSPPMITAGTSTYSRWDDATLRIPTVPAS